MNTIRVYCMTDDKAEKTIRYRGHASLEGVIQHKKKSVKVKKADST